MNSEEETQGLARRAGEGDAASFTALYERMGPALYTWVALRLPAPLKGVLGPEDVLQEVWVRALRSLVRFDPERGGFRRWMIQIAKHTLLDCLRRQRALKLSPQGGLKQAEFLEEVPDQVTSITRRVARQEIVHIFLERVRELDEPDQSLLILAGLEGLPMSEAAGRVGISEAAGAKRWQRLRARLAEERWPPGFLD